MNRLGDLERAIMDILWESRDPLTVRQVSGSLTERDLAHTTVMTVLDRLAKKGFARRGRDGRAWRYRAAATREAYVTELMLNALDQTGDRHAALARFARSVSDTEAAALRRALEALGHAAAREDGAREDGAREVGAREDGARGDGAREHGARGDGAREHGARGDGARGDGHPAAREDGPVHEATGE